jgi:ubiquinone/menaquinone biosynthesis C-methylase UbiE
MDSHLNETYSYAARLELSDTLREPLVAAVIQALSFPIGSRGLDVGCGIGSHTRMLARAVGTGGHVTGVDASPALIEHADSQATDTPTPANICFQQGDMYQLALADDTFDWAWSVDCVGYAPGDPVSVLKELARVVRPGGTVAIMAWSSQQLLPGYPLLEAHLNATPAGMAPFTGSTDPERHFLRALRWFEAAGLEDLEAATFVHSVHAPLNDAIRNALVSLIEMRWGNPPELDHRERKQFKRLCDPGSPDFILNLPDYIAFFTYSLFYGKVARS